jgi:hypothetical protein
MSLSYFANREMAICVEVYFLRQSDTLFIRELVRLVWEVDLWVLLNRHISE